AEGHAVLKVVRGGHVVASPAYGWDRRVLAADRANGRLGDEQFPGDGGRRLSPPRRPGCCTNDEGVPNADAAPAGQVNAWFDGDWNPILESTGPAVPDDRRLVDLQPDTVTESVPEMLPVSGRRDQIPRDRVDVHYLGARERGSEAPGPRICDNLANPAV